MPTNSMSYRGESDPLWRFRDLEAREARRRQEIRRAAIAAVTLSLLAATAAAIIAIIRRAQ